MNIFSKLGKLIDGGVRYLVPTSALLIILVVLSTALFLLLHFKIL